MKAAFPGRSFQLWEYKVSHGMMLVRSPKSAEAPSNIDVMFAGVEYADVPRYFSELRIEEPDPADLSFARKKLGKQETAATVTVLECEGRRYVVVASGIKVVENDMDIFESPFQ